MNYLSIAACAAALESLAHKLIVRQPRRDPSSRRVLRCPTVPSDCDSCGTGGFDTTKRPLQLKRHRPSKYAEASGTTTRRHSGDNGDCVPRVRPGPRERKRPHTMITATGRRRRFSRQEAKTNSTGTEPRSDNRAATSSSTVSTYRSNSAVRANTERKNRSRDAASRC